MENRRFEQRHKKKQLKLNRIYNVLIVLVAVLIVFVGGQMMFGNSEEKETAQPATAQKKEHSHKEKEKVDSMSIYEEGDSEEEPAKGDESAVEEESDEEKSPEEENLDEENPEESAPVIEENPSPGVARSITDPNWQPIGTQQSEPHAATYDKGSVDWNEMLQAVSYATGVNVGDMTVWRIGNNGGPNKAVATISSKSTKQKYRVQIDWVENEGWKPVVMEELN
ncbi:DUF1510 family protein [Bacillus songklensis]|uniref:DUF1510 family protein n=1 Tax=Bacillus songklensis TaxID=1069116 RepID=A0ABV8AYF9_9BACI